MNCKILDCVSVGKPSVNGKRYLVKGFCNKHYLRLKRYGDTNIVKRNPPGIKKHILYATYCSMKARCNNPKEPAYKDYGGRGIKVSESWLGLSGFKNFTLDIGNKPYGYQLDRIDNYGNYCKENCRWATRHQQCANRRSNNKNVGVCLEKRTKRWRSYIDIKSKRIELGTFVTYKEAVEVRKLAEVNYKIK